MIRAARVLGTPITIGMLALALVACGGDDGNSGQSASQSPQGRTLSAQDRGDIEATVKAFATAADAEATCQQITGAFEDALSRGGAPSSDLSRERAFGPAGANCSKALTAAAKKGVLDFGAQKAEVGKVVVDGDRGAAVVRLGKNSSPIFLLRTSDGWKIHATGAPPPDFEPLAKELGR
jgi:hypothetical protein